MQFPATRSHLIALTFLGLVGLPSDSAHSGLIAHYPFDSDFHDISGHGNHLLIGGGTPTITSAVSEHVRGTGALDLVQAGGAFLKPTVDFTFGTSDQWSVSFWARRRPGAAVANGMVVGDNTTTDSFIWLPDNSTQVQGLRFRPVGVGTTNNNDYATGHDTAFHHWVVVAKGAGTIRVYRDNVDLGLRSPSGGTDFKINAIGSGYTGTAQLFDGQIDELRIYDEALDAAAVAGLFALPPTPEPPPAERIHVFLIGGQSNADGRADPAGLPTSPVNLQQPQADVDFFGHGGALTTLRPGSQFGPEITMGRRLAESLGDGVASRVALIKYGVGGTSLAVDWRAGGTATTSGDGPRYVTFQQTVAAGLSALAAAYPGAAIEIEGMLWVQGERDAVIGTENAYETNLAAFIADVRATYGADLPFAISRLSINQTALDAARLAVIRTAQTQVAAADPSKALLDTDGFGVQPDNLHFDTPGQQELGDGAAKHLLQLRPINPLSGFTITPTGMVEITLDDAFPDFAYTLQRSQTLAANEWLDLESVTAGGRRVEFTPFEAMPSREFFRVERVMIP